MLPPLRLSRPRYLLCLACSSGPSGSVCCDLVGTLDIEAQDPRSALCGGAADGPAQCWGFDAPLCAIMTRMGRCSLIFSCSSLDYSRLKLRRFVRLACSFSTRGPRTLGSIEWASPHQLVAFLVRTRVRRIRPIRRACVLSVPRASHLRSFCSSRIIAKRGSSK